MNTMLYILYVGLLDKDTKRQEISTSKAHEIVTDIFVEKIGGATISNAIGVYTHNDGTIVHENTIRIECFGAMEKDILWCVDYLKKAFNQESIAICKQELISKFV